MGEPTETAFDATVASVSRQFETVIAAPIPFVLVVALLAVLIWRWLHHHYDGRLSTKDSLIALREAQLADYKEKLGGASPDAAKARIDALEERINHRFSSLGPARLTPDQRQIMADMLTPFKGLSIQFSADAAAAGSGPAAQSIGLAFDAAGWAPGYQTVLGVGTPPATGVGLLVPDPDNMTPPQLAVLQALEKVGLEPIVARGGPWIRAEEDVRPNPIAEILLTNRFVD